MGDESFGAGVVAGVAIMASRVYSTRMQFFLIFSICHLRDVAFVLDIDNMFKHKGSFFFPLDVTES